jgi:histidyl-tRNA synthetase
MTRDAIPAEELLTKARAVGQYYGFTPLTMLNERARGVARIKKTKNNYTELESMSLDPTAEIVSSFLKQCQNVELPILPRQPVFIWHTNIAPGRPAQKKATVQFHAFSTDRALSVVVVIRALSALTASVLREEPALRINSMGDKETRARYARELTNFFKKRVGILPEECIACAKRDVLEAAELVIRNEWADDLPAPTEHLSDASRKRFEDVLEYLEMTETPYELARTLLSRGGVWNDICFEFVVGGKRVAWGSRYSDFTRHFFPTTFSATGAVLQLASSGAVPKKTKASRLRFSFVHIGDEAKRLAIKLAEDFRRAHVSLSQHLGVESLTEQLHLAERQGSPYLLIMGRKEALESSAILRNRQTQKETVLPLAGLIDCLKTIA